MKIESKIHTIYVTIGANKAGKTFFCQEMLIPSIKKYFNNYAIVDEKYKITPNIQYLSSEDARNEFINNSSFLNEEEVAEHAFDFLFYKLEKSMTFPANSDFIVLDTSGLSETFRNNVTELAEKYQYNVEFLIFDYYKPSDYFAQGLNKTIGRKNELIRKNVYTSIKRSRYIKSHKIKKPLRKEDFNLEIKGFKRYLNTFLSPRYEYISIGDVHGCYDELIELIKKNGFEVSDGKIIGTDDSKINNKFVKFILIGDIFFKGPQNQELLTFVFNNKRWFKIVIGNNEDSLYKSFNEDEVRMKHHMPILNDENKTMFMELFDRSSYFYRTIYSDRRNQIYTHSLCEYRFLGKFSRIANRAMSNYRIVECDNAWGEVKEMISGLVKKNYPQWITGHFAFREIEHKGNIIGIDTGCVYGNKLSSVHFNNGRMVIRDVPLMDKDKIFHLNLIMENYERKRTNVDIEKLPEYEKRRVQYVVNNKINFLSGTMSPSDKDIENNELESLGKALDYYKKSGVGQVVCQPKFMGSRCNVYLDNNIDESYSVSRNGFIIKQIDELEMRKLYISMKEKYQELFAKYDAKTIIFDGELLPWNMMAEGLIDNSFKTISSSVRSELKMLKESGFDDMIDELSGNDKFFDFKEDVNKMNKKALKEKYGSHIYETFMNLIEVSKTHHRVDEHITKIDIYDEQVEIFSADGDLEYKPFNILKIVKNDGSEIVMQNENDVFGEINDSKYVVIDLEDLEGAKKIAQTYYDEVTIDNKMEGVVVKPLEIKPRVAPFLKVRNKNYLTLVYGYDYTFPEKYRALMTNKNIRKKIKLSISDYELGREMLNSPISNLQTNDYTQLIAEFINENIDTGIDPRL